MATLPQDLYPQDIYERDEVYEEVIVEPEVIEPREYPAEFIAWLQNEEERAKNTSLNEERRIALAFYNGEPFGNEIEGQSQVVTRDCAEVVDYTVPSVLRTMASGDRIVEFEALDDGDEEALDEATEAVSQQFMQEQSGWRILHDLLKGALIEKTQACKSYVEVQRKRREEEVTASRLAEILSEDVEIIGQEWIGAAAQMAPEQRAALESAPPEQLDQFGPIMRIAWVEETPRFVDTPIPNEEFGVAPDARSLDTAIYYNHRTTITLSAIRGMGLDADLVTDVGSDGATELSRTRDAETTDVTRDGANKSVDFLEEYCRYDLDGDGIAEFLRVQRVGQVILSAEEIEYGPCEEWCPYPIAHRRVGHSQVDKVMDIQLNRSMLMRQAFNNLYASNNPRLLVNETSIGDSTIEDILNPDFGAIIRHRGETPKPLTIPFVAGNAFQAMEILTGERESRTGITRMNQGLDADALNKTATGTALMQATGQQQEEYIARNFGEFVGRIFEKKYRLMKDYGKPFRIIINGQPRMVDPGRWPDEMRVAVRVGLGTGRKEQRVQNRLLLLNMQKEAAQTGDPHVKPEQIYNSVKGIVADLGLGQASDYYDYNPDEPEQPEAPKQDPEVLKVQAESQRKMAEAQNRHTERMAEIQARAQRDGQELQLRQQSAVKNAELDQMKAQFDAQLKQARADFEASLAEVKLEREWMLAQIKASTGAMPTNRAGGDLSV